MGFTSQQQDVIDYQGNQGVVAVPGSGKTATSIGKAVDIVRRNPSAKVVMVVFNSSASGEIIARLEKAGIQPKNYCVGTYHALALSQLRAKKWKREIISNVEKYHLMSRAWAKAGKPCEYEDIESQIDKYKTDTKFYLGGKKEISSEYNMFREYQDLLSEYDVVDFNDILMTATQMMVRDEIDPIYATHIIADEFQDSDEVQFAWLAAHYMKLDCTMMAVGDDDQTIYSWRNALGVDAFKRFEKIFSARLTKLTTNFRSYSEILGPADLLIRNNVKRIPKELTSYKGQGGGVKIVPCINIDEEIEELIDVIRSTNYENFAVLARRNDILRKVENSLNEANIPCKRLGGKGYWDQDEPALLITVLNAIVDKTMIGVECVLERAGLGVEQLNNRAETIKDGMLSGTIEKVDNEIKNWRRYPFTTEEGTNLLITDVSEFLAGLVKKGTKQAQKAAERYIQAAGILSKWNGSWRKRRSRLQTEKSIPKDQICLLTMHVSKGLEFDRCWIIAADNNVIPATEENDIELMEDERRLMYVAITRSERLCYVSHSKNPSRFINEMLGIENELEEDETETEIEV